MSDENFQNGRVLYRARGLPYRMGNHINVSETVCSQCGACVSICPKAAITMPRTASGNYYPVVDEGKCIDSCRLCTLVCAGNGIDWERLYPWRFGVPYNASPLDHYIEAFTGFAADEGVRRASASGGLVTALLCHALETGAIEGAVVSRLKTIEPVTTIARTPEEIRAAATSIYFSNPMLRDLDQIRRFEGRLAVVGLPCHIASLYKAVQRRVVKANQIVLTVALICGRTASFDLICAFLRGRGIDADEIEGIRMRGDGWPGSFRIVMRDGRTHTFPYPAPDYMAFWKYYQYTPLYCLLCSDPLGALADITVGDAWMPEFEDDDLGRSLALVRSRDGQAFLDAARGAGKVRLEKLEPQRILHAQRQQVFGKRLNQRTVRRLFKLIRPITQWPMPNDTGTGQWAGSTLLGWAYGFMQLVNCTLSARPGLQWILRILPVKMLERWRRGKRACRK